ncbi:ORF6N domain-containing protein [Planctomycetota bacterium]
MLRPEIIEQKIFYVRGQRVMFDRDLADLYGIQTGALNRAVSRNKNRFPEDFMLRLTSEEFQNLICHFGISSWGGTRTEPRAFTEHGILMLSSVLRSKRAIQVNIQIMRTFSKMRQLIQSHKDILKKIEEMENRYDTQFKMVFQAIREIMEPEDSEEKRRIGFK